MANQKTTELRTLTSNNVSNGDWIPIVDVSELTSPTGETKKISTKDLAEYVVSGGFANYAVPQHGYQNSNGLSFAPYFAPQEDNNEYCYGNISSVGSNFALTVRAFIPSDADLSETGSRILFGVGSELIGMAESGSRAFIGVQSSSLIAYVNDGAGTEKIIEYTDFITKFPDRAFDATISKTYDGKFLFYVNAELVGQLTGIPGSINSSYVTMGNGQYLNHWNINCVIYEAHIFNTALTGTQIRQNYYGGVRNTDSTLAASYRPENLNPGPTQWLDSVGDSHLILPMEGAEATSPTKQFGLIFFNDGTSGYLGNGTQRPILPENYVLTDAFVYSPGAPCLSIGTSEVPAYEGASGIDSFNNNRVPLVSASYGRNVLPLLELGVAHTSRSLYVFYSASAAPCTFSFQGYTSKYGVINYIPPSPTPTPTPTVTMTPSQPPPTPTPTTTATPTQTPPLPPGIYLSSVNYKQDEPAFVFTNNSAITSLTRYKLRVKAQELVGLDPHLFHEQRANVFNSASVTIDVPPVGTYTTDLYYVQYGNTPDSNGNYPVLSVNGGAPFTTVTMSVATSSFFSPPPYPGDNVYISATTYSFDNPPYIYTGNPTVLSSFRYKLRCKVAGQSGGELVSSQGAPAQHRTQAWSNNYSKIYPVGVGTVAAELYWLKYDSSYTLTIQPTPWQVVTMSCTTASGFIPVTPPAYVTGGYTPNVYLSGSTAGTMSFSYTNPPYIYTTDPTVLASTATGSYRLRCKARYWDGTTWQLLPDNAEHRAVCWNNQYERIRPPVPGYYNFTLYWIKYPTGVFSSEPQAYSGDPYNIDVVITP